jgi:predicted 3-demethylubiquinone-9 3-methyltransferase (glyoxalase superfamily)
MATLTKITPCLWFDTQALEAAEFYTSVFEGSRIVEVRHYGSAGPREEGLVMTVTFELAGQGFLALNGGPQFTFDEAISFQVNCESQEELDRFWSVLSSEGGSEGPCGWLKDRFGLSWQIVPVQFDELLRTAEPEAAQRAIKAMLGMGKLDMAALEKAAAG